MKEISNIFSNAHSGTLDLLVWHCDKQCEFDVVENDKSEMTKETFA